MHLVEIVPGYLDVEKRVHQTASEQLNQSFETNGNDFDVLHQTDDLNLANGNQVNCPHKANASGTTTRMCIPVDKRFFERVLECQQAHRELRSAFEMQRAEIIKLRKENGQLKSDLDRLK